MSTVCRPSTSWSRESVNSAESGSAITLRTFGVGSAAWFNRSMGGAKQHSLYEHDRGFEDVEGTICLDHIVDLTLRKGAGLATAHACVFCGRGSSSDGAAFAVEMSVVMEVFMTAFWHHYGREGTIFYAGGYAWGSVDTRDAVDALASDAFQDEEVMLKVIDVMVESITDTEVSDLETDAGTDYLSFGWERFSHIAKHVSRFVVPSDASDRSPMSEVHGFLEDLQAYVDGTHNLVQTVPAGTTFYRGRPVEDRFGEIPVSFEDLGLAPVAKAAANRMSPAGISLFYCSSDVETAIAELAVHGVEPFASVGAFVSQVDLRILDLTEVPSRPSPFNLELLQEGRMLAFLDEFAREVTRPVIPDGRQHFEYAPTQVITEYFRWAPKSRLDGIALRSAQTTRKTFVLFVDRQLIDSTSSPWKQGTFFPLLDEGLLVNPQTAGPVLTMDDEQTRLYEVHRTVRPASVGFRSRGQWIMDPLNVR